MNNAAKAAHDFNNQIASAALTLAFTGSDDDLYSIEAHLATVAEHFFGTSESARAVYRNLRELAYQLRVKADESVIEKIEDQLQIHLSVISH